MHPANATTVAVATSRGVFVSGDSGERFDAVATGARSSLSQWRGKVQGVATVKRFYEELAIRSLAVYVDPSMGATATLGALGVPTTLLIDREGREIGRRTGPAEWDGPQALRIFEDYVNRDKK